MLFNRTKSAEGKFMEQIMDAEKRKNKTANQKEGAAQTSVDWVGFSFTIASWVLQGAALAAGGALMSRSIKVFSSEEFKAVEKTDGDVIPLRRSVSV